MNKKRHLKNIMKRKFYVDIHITDHCDLNCRGCAHFSPVAEPFFIKPDDLEMTYKKLKPVYRKFFNSIHLLGGEPLLHPQLEKILQITRTYFPETEIQLITNGLKLEQMSESFWKMVQDYHIKICITQYPLQHVYDDIRTCLDEKKVSYEIYFAYDFIHHTLEDEGRQNPKSSYRKCRFGGSCLQIRNNRLFPCPQMAYIEHLNHAYNRQFQYSKGDYLELDDLQSRYKFYKFILSSKRFCRYCNVDEEHLIKWGISDKKMEEWMK